MTNLDTLKFGGYKAFGSIQSLELRPVTLLFGHNSVGKSAALRLLKVLSDASKEREFAQHGSTILDYQSAALRGANLEDVTFNGGSSSGIYFEFIWSDGLAFAFEIREFTSRKTEGVSRFRINRESKMSTFDNVDPDGNVYETDTDNDTISVIVEFSGIVPRLVSAPEAYDRASIDAVSQRLVAFSSNVHWISAVRSQPPRNFLLEPGTPTSIQPDGSGTAEALRSASMAESAVANDVSVWLSKVCNCTLSFASTDGYVVQDRQYFPFAVVPGGTGRPVAVRDVGEGVAQALPVITLCRMAASGLLGTNPILALEQPELHLHPKAGAALAEGLIHCVEHGSPAMHVVETHSESFLLSLQIALLERRLKIDDVVIYWASPSDDGTVLRKITFDQDGYPSEGWPDSVFRETLEQARRVGELRLSK